MNEERLSMPENGSKIFLIVITVIAALGGLLFGYDTAVISGTVSDLRNFFNLTPASLGFAVSSALIGCVLGSMFAGKLSGKFGRKKALIWASIFYLISAIGSGIPGSSEFGFWSFIGYRVIGGFGVGIASMVSPMYIAEVAPAKIRGRLVACNQFAIIFGMLVVYFVNYFVALSGGGFTDTAGISSWNVNTAWRFMFWSESIPAILFFVALLCK